MLVEKRKIWENGEYDYPLAFGFEPNLVGYLQETACDCDKEAPDEGLAEPGENGGRRPCMVIVPGGGYCLASPTEGEIVAKRFLSMGYQTFVLTYTTNPLMAVPLKDQPMRDLSRAIRYIRRNAKSYGIDENRIAVCGFSAGAHLCGSLCVHYKDVTEENQDYVLYSNRPDAAILSYPVITSGEYAHEGSFQALAGKEENEETKKWRNYFSLEYHVTPETPPCFLWQTVSDDTVPVENSYLFAKACKENGVPHAHHIFNFGWHGLSLADAAFTAGDFGDPYPMEQMVRTLEAVENDSLPIALTPEERETFLKENRDVVARICRKIPEEPWMPEVAMWPVLAEKWLNNQWRIKWESRNL